MSLISKQIDKLRAYAKDRKGELAKLITDAADTIEMLSAKVREPKWIPCVDGNEPKANAECWISTSAKYVRRASYAPKANNQPNGFIVTDGGFGFYEYGKSAKAWMPYKEPEPYREEGGM